MSVSYKWRFVDAYEFTYFGVLKLAQAQDVAHMDYIAISYRWSSDMVAWRDELASTGRGAECGYEERMRRGSIAITDDIESGRGGDNQALARAHLFFTTVAFLVITAGKRYFWMDIVCINQDEPAEKEFFVPRMGSLYRGAAITHVYPTGTKILSTVASEELYFPEWDTRAWTLQEHILSSNVFFCYAFEGVSMTDIVRIAQGESAQIPIGPIVQFPGAPKLVERFRACEWDGASCVEWYKRNDITCLIEKESFHGGFSLSALLELEVTQKGDWSGFHRGVARSSYFKTIFQLRQEGTRISPVRTSLISLGGRRATVPEDMAYCLLGVLGMEDFAVKYDVGFEEARLAMFEAMPEDMLALILGTDWRCNQSSRFNDSALPRLSESIPTIGIDLVQPTALAKFERTAGTTIYARMERFRLWKDLRRKQTQSLGVVQSAMGKQVLIMYCTSLLDDPHFSAIPSCDIPEEKVHIVLLDTSRISEEDYADDKVEYDRIVDFMEIGECMAHGAMIVDDMERSSRTSLLVLECEQMSQSNYMNRGTALIMDASMLSSEFGLYVIQ